MCQGRPRTFGIRIGGSKSQEQYCDWQFNIHFQILASILKFVIRSPERRLAAIGLKNQLQKNNLLRVLMTNICMLLILMV